jgi:DNA-binding transcriptional ArsR family regulator
MDSFAALAEPRRREILRVVHDGPRSVSEIAARFDVTQQAISLHLRALREAGLVEMRADGPRHLYGVRPEGLEEVRAFVEEFWPERMRRLKTAVEDEING